MSGYVIDFSEDFRIFFISILVFEIGLVICGFVINLIVFILG